MAKMGDSVMDRQVYLMILIILIALVSVPIVLARAPFEVDILPSSQKIKMNETAVFDLNIKNNLDSESHFSVYSADVEWDILTNPTSVRVASRHADEAKLFIKPLYVKPGLYNILLNVRSSSQAETLKKLVTIEVSSLEPKEGEYLPSIKAEAVFPAEIDPRDDPTLSLNIRNLNKRNLSRVDIKVRSNLINMDHTTEIAPLETRAIDLPVSLNDLTNPQSDTLEINIFTYKDDQPFQYLVTPIDYSIIEYGILEDIVDISRSFLKIDKTIKITNTGNAKKAEIYKIKTGWFRNLFTTTEPDARCAKLDGTRYLLWDLELGIGESISIRSVSNFRILFYLMCAIIIGLIVYYIFRSPIFIRKSAIIIGTKEGGISHIKIIIHVLNRSRHSIKDLSVLDKVPKIAEVIKEFEVGTLQPIKIIHSEKKGSLVKWRIDELDSKEERVLSYKIKSRLTIVGGLTLPHSIVRFPSPRSGKERVTSSERKTLRLEK